MTCRYFHDDKLCAFIHPKDVISDVESARWALRFDPARLDRQLPDLLDKEQVRAVSGSIKAQRGVNSKSIKCPPGRCLPLFSVSSVRHAHVRYQFPGANVCMGKVVWHRRARCWRVAGGGWR